jgi:hypothetical protein
MQALTALNEPLFQECSIALAKKCLQECESETDEGRIRFIVWRCLGRDAAETERRVLQDYLTAQRNRIRGKSLSPGEILKSGESLDLSGLDQADLAACTLLSRVVLNLDEAITRE